jgi:replicative DNA helicase
VQDYPTEFDPGTPPSDVPPLAPDLQDAAAGPGAAVSPAQAAPAPQNIPDFRRSRRERSPVDLSKIDRLPPHSVPAEQGVLGCALISPNEALNVCIASLKAGAEAFYDLRHQTLYETLVQMAEARAPIDLITVQQRLKDSNLLEAVGGLGYLSSLQDAVPSAANLHYYLEIVREKLTLRRLMQACTAVVSRAQEHEGEVATLMDEVERDILKINEDRESNGVRPMNALVKGAIDLIQDYHRRQGGLTGLGSGFTDFDRMTSGMHGGEMIVIAARPSMGKTSLVMNIAEHVAIVEGQPVGVFSLEMTSESLVMRMLCSLARVNMRSIRDGFMAQQDFQKLTGAAAKLARAKLHIDDTPGLSILQLRARARRMHQQHGIKLFIIDYLQLMHSTSRKAQDNRQQEISEISSGVKALAKELSVPVIVLSQLNRELEKDKNRKPRLSDLRESGAIEQDADLVGLLYKPSGNEEEEVGETRQPAESHPVNLLIAKQRNGPTGDVCLTFFKSFTRFESAAKLAPED